MKCEECGSNFLSFDDRMGELSCDICGYVDVQNFEETVSPMGRGGEYGEQRHESVEIYGLGTEKKRRDFTPINECFLMLSEFIDSIRIRNEVASYYQTLQTNHVFRGYTISERSAALVYFTLKANHVRVQVAALAKISGAKPNRISKCARKIARYFKRPSVLSQLDIRSELDAVKYALDLSQSFPSNSNTVYEAIRNSTQLNLNRPATIAGIVWITLTLKEERGITMAKLGKVMNLNKSTISRAFNEILKTLGLTKNELKQLTLEEFAAGCF